MKNISKRWMLIAGFSAVVFIGLSLLIGLRQSVWFDEAYSINLAKRDFGEIIDLTSVDVHPPAYYLLLKIWGTVFGFSELSLRALSILAMALAIVVGIILIKKIAGTKAAVLASLFLSLSPMLIRYGFEIRMYAIATLIAVLASLVLWDILHSVDRRKKRLLQLLYACLVAIGMLTLYYTIVVWVTHLVYLVYRTKKEKKPILKQDFWIVYALSVLIFLPWLPVVFGQLGNGALAAISERLNLTNMMGIVSFNFIYRPVWQTDQILGLVLMIFVIALIVVLVRLRFRDAEKRDGFIFLAFLAIAPIILEFIICLVAPMYVERYLVYSAPFLIMLIVIICLNSEWKKILIAYTGGVLILGLVNLWQVGNYNFQRLQKPDIKKISMEISEHNKDTVIMADSPYEAIELGYYLDEESYFYAPYEKLSGGYAVLDGSEKQIRNEEDLNRFRCVRYVFYDENSEGGVLLTREGFEVEKRKNVEGAMKYKDLCRN